MTKNHGNSKETELFPPGQCVKIVGTRNSGEIVEGPNRRNQYCVLFGAIKIWIEKDKLKATQTLNRKEKKSTKTTRRAQEVASSSTVDFHGMTVAQALEAAEEALDRALMANSDRIQLIHGIGTGKLKAAIQAYMTKSPHVSRCAIDPHNPGTSWAFLDGSN